MTDKDYQARITELETENSQLRERLSSEVSEVERLTDEIHELQEEFAGAYGKLKKELMETKLGKLKFRLARAKQAKQTKKGA